MSTLSQQNGAQPFLKWAGGKGQLLSQYALFLKAAKGGTYHEPFLGSGAVFFYMQRQDLFERYLLSDTNEELINLFCVVRNKPEDLLERLKEHKEKHDKDYYYRIRELDRHPSWKNAPEVERAARMLYLNKTCYNGLWRVNSKGHFNVPIGRYKNPDIYNPDRIREASKALQNAEVHHRPFDTVLDYAHTGDFIYFDPPYVPLSDTSNFTSYSADSFGIPEQEKLADIFKQLAKKKCQVMLSNSDTEVVRSLYKRYSIKIITARRAINSKPGRRGVLNELIIINYEKQLRTSDSVSRQNSKV